MQWILRLSKLTFDIEYNKGNLNSEADVLSSLRFLRHTTVALNDDIAAYPDDATLSQEQVALISELEVLDHLVVTHDDLQEPALLPINIDEMLPERQADRFCGSLIARLQNGEVMLFSQNEDSMMSRLAYKMNKSLYPRPCRQECYTSAVMKSNQSTLEADGCIIYIFDSSTRLPCQATATPM